VSEDAVEITAEQLVPQLSGAGQDYTLLDVREYYELGRGVLPGATVIPMSELQARVEELPRDKSIVCYCEHGVRSYDVTLWLQQQGYKARSLQGGFAEWRGDVASSQSPKI
jgi:rhodanese-related sulfurtransferase